MYLLNFEHWVSTVFVDAVGATFAHSLWQSLIALIVCHLALAATRRSSPATRYNVLVGIALLLAFTVLSTFILQFDTGTSSKNLLVTYVPFQEILNDNGKQAMPVVLQYQYILSMINGFLSRYMDVLIAIWFIVFCFKWLRLSIGLSYIKRIARFESSKASHEWQSKFDLLKQKLQISSRVSLLQSNIIKVPMTSGYFKPIIIVPVSLFTNMPTNLVESILLHELAHIRRKDFLVNILQSFAETIFFFNPFILKISSLIRDERENCCDSIAVDVVQNKVSYVEALMAFGEYSNRSTLAMAFAGKKNYLLQRVKRILYNQNKKPGVMEKSILTFGVILFVGLALFSTVKGTEKVLNSPFVKSFQQPVTDTVPDNRKPTKREVRRAQRDIKDRQEKVEKKRQELQQAIDDMEKDVKKYHDELGDEVEINDEELKELIEKNELNFKNDLNLKHDLKFDEVQKVNQVEMQKLQKQIELMELEKIKPLIDEQTKIQMQKQQQIMEAQAIEFKQHQKQLMQLQKEQLKLQKIQLDSLKTNVLILGDKVHADVHLSIRPTQNQVMDEILLFLEHHNVANASGITSVTLNADELVVNGNKQPASLHEQLKRKYLNVPGDYVTFYRQGDSIAISMQIHQKGSGIEH